MAKILVDATLWDDDWFFELTADQKLLWQYLLQRSSVGGFVARNERLIETYLSVKIDWPAALSAFGDRVVRCGPKFWIPDALLMRLNCQILNPENKAHLAIIRDLKSNQMWDKFRDKFTTIEVCEHTQPLKTLRSSFEAPSKPPNTNTDTDSREERGVRGEGRDLVSKAGDSKTVPTQGPPVRRGQRLTEFLTDEATGSLRASYEGVGDLVMGGVLAPIIPAVDAWIEYQRTYHNANGMSLQFQLSDLARMSPEVARAGIKVAIRSNWKTVREHLARDEWEREQSQRERGINV